MIRFDDIIEKISGKYSEKDLRILQKAYVFAAKAHRGQTRRSGEPYMSHPLEVTNILAEMNLDLTTLVAGLLHDHPSSGDGAHRRRPQPRPRCPDSRAASRCARRHRGHPG